MYLTNKKTNEIIKIRSISLHLLKDKMYSVEFLKFKDIDQLNRFDNNALEEYEVCRNVVFYAMVAIDEKLNELVAPEYTVLDSLLRAMYLAYVSLNPDWEFVEK